MKPLIAALALAVLTAGPAFALGKEASADKPNPAPMTQAEDDPATKAAKSLQSMTGRIVFRHFSCNAVLVAKNVVLTAAHCVTNGIEGLQDVRFPDASPRKILPCASKDCAELFVGDKHGGLALVAFEGPELTRHQPASLIAEGAAVSPKTQLIAACRDVKSLNTIQGPVQTVEFKKATLYGTSGLTPCGAEMAGGPAVKLGGDGGLVLAGVINRPACSNISNPDQRRVSEDKRGCTGAVEVTLLSSYPGLRDAITALQKAAEKKTACSGGSGWGCK